MDDLLRMGGRMEREEHLVRPKFVDLRASYEKGVSKTFLQRWVAEEVLIFFLLWFQP